MTNNEAKNIIIDNQMTYNDFAKYFNISTSDAIKIFQHLDLKRCCRGIKCSNPNGPIQSRQNFYNNKKEKDELNNQCNYCQRQHRQINKEHYKKYNQKYYQNNKEYLNQRHHQYYQNNKEYCNQINRQNWQINKEYYKQHYKEYYQNNKEHRKQVSNQYYQNNKEHCNQRHHQYYHNNKEYFNQKTKEYKSSYTKFDKFNEQISYAEKTRRDPDNLDLLQVKCTYCNSWFNPTNRQVQDRIISLNGKNKTLGSESRFYCSDECKQACPIYYQQEYSKDNPKYYKVLGTSREVQSELRQLVFERDNWTCQKCLNHKDNLPSKINLHCHHKEGIKHEPIESADIDMCITVCSSCHKEIHKIPGCRTQDMQCKVNEYDPRSIQ